MNGIAGHYTVEEALRLLVMGTCLDAEFGAARDVTVRFIQPRGVWFMKKRDCQKADVRPALLAGLVGAAALSPAAAQVPERPAASSVLQEITVTARKREENLQDVPLSITAISSESIERQNIDNLRDIGALVPNLNLSARTDGFPNVTIRGVGGFGNTQGVGFYLDDVQLFSDATSRFGDLARIEVLKGPQGTLYGGSNIGGAIKFVSVRPDPSGLSGSIKARAGERSILDVEGSLNMPLGDSGWAVRAFGFMAEDDGYITNQNPPRLNGVRGTNDPNIGYSDEAGARLSVAGVIADVLSVYGSARWNRLEGTGNTWIREESDDFRHLPIANYSSNPTIDRETYAGTLELSADVGSLSVVSLTSYTDTESRRYNDIDAREEIIFESDQPQEMQVFTQELRLTSNNEGPFNWIVGAYYSMFEEQMDSVQIWFDARVDADGNISGALGCALGMPTCSGVWAGEVPTPEQEASSLVLPFEIREREKSHMAFFANANYTVNEWEFDLGVRADTWKNMTNNLDLVIRSEQDDLEIMPRLSISRNLGEGTMVYFTYAQGFEPGGYNMTNFAGDDELASYGIEEATSYELGFKSEFLNRRLLFNAALFYIDYEARQVEYQVQRDAQLIEGIFNLGDSEQYGVEAELQFRATDSLSLSASIGWISAEWVDGTTIDLISSVVDLSGENVPNVNDLSWVLGLDYQKPIRALDDATLFAGIQVSRNGEFEGLQVWDPVRNPPYTLVHAQLGIRKGSWEFLVQAENLTDEDYHTDAQRFPNLHVIDGLASVNIGTLGPPRLFTASLKYSF